VELEEQATGKVEMGPFRQRDQQVWEWPKQTHPERERQILQPNWRLGINVGSS